VWNVRTARTRPTESEHETATVCSTVAFGDDRVGGESYKRVGTSGRPKPVGHGHTLMTETTLYDRLGGREGIEAVVDEFYDRLVADDELGPFFEDSDLEMLRRTQTDFLCEAAGGPESYDAAPVREAHLHVPFTATHVQRAIDILEEALAAFDVPDDDADEVVQAIAAYEADLLATPSDDDG